MSTQKISIHKARGRLLHPITPPNTLFDQMGMDPLGPFPLSAASNKCIIVATDYLACYVKTKAVPHATAYKVAFFFKDHTAYKVAFFFMDHIVLGHSAPVSSPAAFTEELPLQPRWRRKYLS